MSALSRRAIFFVGFGVGACLAALIAYVLSGPDLLRSHEAPPGAHATWLRVDGRDVVVPFSRGPNSSLETIVRTERQFRAQVNLAALPFDESRYLRVYSGHREVSVVRPLDSQECRSRLCAPRIGIELFLVDETCGLSRADVDRMRASQREPPLMYSGAPCSVLVGYCLNEGRFFFMEPADVIRGNQVR